jgi:hypothetical protein
MENCIFGICNNAMGERRELNPRMVEANFGTKSISKRCINGPVLTIVSNLFFPPFDQ